MNLISMIDRALASDLSKNDWRVFATLLRQTLGFGKTGDALTMGRIAMISGIRKDHCKKAVESVTAAGLFERFPHPAWEHEYIVPQSDKIKFSRPAKAAPAHVPVAAPPCPTTTVKFDEVINEATRTVIEPKLSALRSADAQAVCDLLAQAIRNNSIRTSPTGLAVALIRAAINGQLDTSGLPQRAQGTPPPRPVKEGATLDRLELNARESYYRQVAALTNRTVEEVRAADTQHKRTAGVSAPAVQSV